ncbi:HAD family hydrolase [Cohnella hongkongensis]|jgi:putative hydrolase of the HAD superfamily|uniref:HAD family hydrolase n=1 Tax=Cohnella hongkongensis TaxID=178337 RepID=A0ABV9FF38_9BACL
MRAEVVVFDLDDTLYEELTYVHSGFRAVASFLAENYEQADAEDAYRFMVTEEKRSGRGRVFDRLLERYGIGTQARVRQCVQAYRTHTPHIRLYPDARRALEALADRSLYIVTDGHARVQEMKLRALGLDQERKIRRCWVTRRYGLHNEKPSPYCFQRICEMERVEPQRVVYVGDNPNKDFVGIKPLGYRTVRILRGAYASVRLTEDYEADHTVLSLDELPVLLG